MAESDEPKQPSKPVPMQDITVPARSPAPAEPEGAVAEPADTEEAEPATGADADPETDEAVDDIMKQDGDEALKAQDDVAEKATVMKQGRWERCKNFAAAWWADPRKRWGSIGGILLVLVILFAVPFTRYNILGLVLRSTATVRVVDSKTGAPVSGATVELAGQTAQTEANGKAQLRVHAGSKNLQVSKKYYRGYSSSELVALSASRNTFKATLVALGHQVKVKVVNKLSGQPVAGASVSAGGASAKTSPDGLATLVIPSGADTQAAKVSVAGYNTAKVSIAATGDVAKNTFGITPAGKLYFLSNLSGKIDVVKTNLDGTDRQTVLAGTGNEDRNTTSLLASRDWKYLALLSKRAGGDNASVYLIDTTNGDKLTTVDQGNATFSFVGWSGDRFIYQVSRGTVSDWQPDQQALKSLDATTGQTLLLDQTQASGTSQSDYVKQYFGSPYIIGNQVVYAKNWTSAYNSTNMAQVVTKQAELDSIGADGSGHRVIKSFTLDSGTQSSGVSITAELYEPDGLYIQFSSGTKDNFYDYDDGKVTDDTTMTADKFYANPYPTYLLSPSGNATFWADQRDGKNALFTGDADGKSPKQIATLSDYATYGWYTDGYLLVSKNSSELYIMPATGPSTGSGSTNGTPFKITDYYKPAINYNGYGGGYGGL
jgi:hypothetical protein